MTDFEEMDKRTQEVLLQVAKLTNMSVQEVVERCGALWQAVVESVAVVTEQIGDVFAELPDLPRPPAKIKKDIKHEKNPMRLKQLNKELNESYKAYKRK